MWPSGPGVWALVLRFRDPGFKTISDHSLHVFVSVSPWFNSTSQLHLYIANWFASGQSGFLTVVVVVLFRRFVDCVSLNLKAPGLWGAVN